MVILYWQQPKISKIFNRKVERHRTWVRITRYNCVRTYFRNEMSESSWIRMHKLMVTGRRPSTVGGGMTKYFGYQGIA